MTTLLEKAKQLSFPSSRKHPTKDELDLMLAFLKGEVSYKAVATVLGASNNNIYERLGSIILRSARAGMITVAEAGEETCQAI